MKTKPLFPNREIHLDFHTSGMIPGIGSAFDPAAFANTFKEAGVTGVCLFSRGHHGWCYYPTEIGENHPHSQIEDLLGEQYRALQNVGIVPSLYTTVCWDERQSELHPEWLCQRENGAVMKMHSLTNEVLGPFGAGWRFLCWNSPYRDYVAAQSVEVVKRHPDADYLFVDILFNHEPCCCPHCIKRMQEHGLNAKSPTDRMKNSIDSAREFMEFLNAAVHEIVEDMPMFYNSRLRVTGDVANGSVPELQYLGATIIESLPSGPWGYDHFPLFARYFQNFEHKMMGHTGKFQKMWGDFGGLKNQAALEYEVIRMMAFGATALIGDQLPPNGLLDRATYTLIGNTYNKVKDVEEHLLNSTPRDEIAIILTHKEARVFDADLDAEYGSMKMLTQLQYQFSFIDQECDFAPYKVIILPDFIIVDDALKEKLNAYIAGGGKIMVSNESGLDSGGQWNIDALAITNLGEYPHCPYYLYPGDEMLANDIVEDTDHVQYLGGQKVSSDNPANQILATITDPYFTRRWDHFCSHLQTPPNERTTHPQMIFNGDNVVYFASSIFSCYNQFASKCDRKLVDYGLSLLLDKKKVQSNLPSTAEVTLRTSSIDPLTSVLTIMHYVPQRRTSTIDIIEDIIPLHNIEFSITDNAEAKSVFDAATGEEIPSTNNEGTIKFTLDKVDGYRVILIK